MKLTFVIPAFNEEKTIGPCLKSIINEIDDLALQKEVELVVVDNASLDNTAQICAAFSQVQVIREPKKGPNFARASGLQVAKGELVANIDADNSLPPGWLAKVLKEFESEKNLVCLSGPLVYREFNSWQNFLVKFFYYLGYGCYLLNNFLKVGSMVQGGNYVVKREIFQKAGGHNIAIDFYGDDGDISRRLIKFGKVKFDFGLPIYSSGRRLLAEGIVSMGLKYAINYFWILYLKRPFSKDYQNHR